MFGDFHLVTVTGPDGHDYTFHCPPQPRRGALPIPSPQPRLVEPLDNGDWRYAGRPGIIPSTLGITHSRARWVSAGNVFKPYDLWDFLPHG